MTQSILRWIAVAVLVSLAACGGGGGSSLPADGSDPATDPGADGGATTDPGSGSTADPGADGGPATDPGGDSGSTTDPGTETPVTRTITLDIGLGSTLASSQFTLAADATQSWDLTPHLGFELTSAEGCGGTLQGTTFTVANPTADCTVTVRYTGTRYVVDSQRDTANIAVVKPGLAYTCGIHRSQWEPPFSEETKDQLIVSSVFLPPYTETAQMGGGFVVDENNWFLSPTYVGDGESVPEYVSGIGSCDITSVQDGEGKDYLFVAYDEMQWDGIYSYKNKQRQFRYVVIPLAASGMPEPAANWTYVAQTAEKVANGATNGSWNWGYYMWPSLPQVKVSTTGRAINMVFLRVVDGCYLGCGLLGVNYFHFPTITDAINENVNSQEFADFSFEPSYTQYFVGVSTPGTLDAKAVGDTFEVSWLNHSGTEGTYTLGAGGIRRLRFRDGELVEDIRHFTYEYPRRGYRADADFIDQRPEGGDFKFTWDSFATVYVGVRISRAGGASNPFTAVRYYGSALINEAGDAIVPDEFGTSYGYNQSAIAWDTIAYGNELWTLFRDPTADPATRRFALRRIPPDVFTNSSKENQFWPTPAFVQYRESDGTPWNYTPGVAQAQYPLPDMPDYRTRTRCHDLTPGAAYDPRLSNTATNWWTRGQCNNLVRAQLYQRDPSWPEELLILYPDSEYRLAVALETLPTP